MPRLKIGLIVLVLTACCEADFVETFSGTGPHASSLDVLDGFDNPGWRYIGDGMFRDGGLWLENSTSSESRSDFLGKDDSWTGGFTSTVEIRDHTLSLIPDSDGVAWIGFIQDFGQQGLSLSLFAMEDSPDQYRASLVSGAPRDVTELTVDRGPHILMSIVFDEATSQATYRYDNNLDDNVPPITLATLDYSGTISEDATLLLGASRITGGQADALIDHWSFTSTASPVVPGDFNANGTFDAEDIDLLNAEIRSGTDNPDFDLTADGAVDQSDRNLWVHSLGNTYFGDADLSGEFTSVDLVIVFRSAEYEDNIPLNSTWLTGDWDGNADFDSFDLVLAFQDGGYEQGPRPLLIPEPTSILWCLLPFCLLGRKKRSTRSIPWAE